MNIITNTKKEKSSHWFLIILFIIFPYFYLLHSLFGSINIFNVSLIYLIIVSSLIFYFLFFVKKRHYYFNDFLVLILLTLIVLSIRLLIGISGNISNPIIFLNKARFVFLIPVMIILCREILNESSKRDLVEKAIISIGLISAIVAIGYSHGLHSIRPIGNDPQMQAIVAQGLITRASGIWSASNFYAAMLVLSLWVLFKRNITKFTLPLILILYYGIIVSGSKLSIIVATLLTLYYFFIYKKKKTFIIALFTTLILCIIFSGIFYQSLNLQRAYSLCKAIPARIGLANIGEALASRFSKGLVGIKALFSNPVFLLIGTDTKSLIDPSKESGIEASSLTFSDNSFIQGMVAIGIPLFFLFLYICKKCFVENFKGQSLTTYLFLFYVIITLLINNAILWDTWIFYAVMTYFLLKSDQTATGKEKLKNIIK